MARRKASTYTEVELEFMHVVWESGEVGTEEVQRVLRRSGRGLSDGSVRKVLSILVRKGHLTRRKTGRSFLYKAKIPQKKANIKMVQDLLKRGFRGSPSLMMAALLESRTVNKRDMKRIQQLIAKYERQSEQ
ncbi:MAG: BlaI/MecI/CopY family transcriptional regulator [Planctomycetes bacterium]|nr:BlaI/MecI/CopY family transcriptional regulator [Planctomycetota bacterium]